MNPEEQGLKLRLVTWQGNKPKPVSEMNPEEQGLKLNNARIIGLVEMSSQR